MDRRERRRFVRFAAAAMKSVAGDRVWRYGARHISGAACCEHRPRGDRLSVEPGRPRGTGYSGGDPRKAATRRALTHAGRLTTRRTNLLMANQNPTDAGSAVALMFPPAQSALLCARINDCLAGLEDDLAAAGDRHPHLARARGEAAAYRQLLLGLAGGEVVPEPVLVQVVAELARAADEANDYERVLLEHAALHALLVQLGCIEAAAAR